MQDLRALFRPPDLWVPPRSKRDPLASLELASGEVIPAEQPYLVTVGSVPAVAAVMLAAPVITVRPIAVIIRTIGSRITIVTVGMGVIAIITMPVSMPPATIVNELAHRRTDDGAA
jgi:hypothetical protein